MATLLAGAFCAGAALAQNDTGPSTAGTTAAARYTGPTTVQPTTVKALLANGKDDQNAILRGRIVSHDGGEHYTFDDGTGRIRVEIDAKRFPAGRSIDDKMTVELVGELDKGIRSVEFDVDEVRILP
ncbi:NirD/YgiW/YdeI family stress tolerance protein [Imbroritus primus]|uniref:NirD/YgiW/YdeI family stress tolerance protein n=2 Tax=Imbroritus primus TaxID=3058603 RepID=A0ACD3SRZ5_9BURK|nr:NirD/YgiW/YdeI family stress tolerance protein [Burkholderiaceae bacterium PBA]